MKNSILLSKISSDQRQNIENKKFQNLPLCFIVEYLEDYSYNEEKWTCGSCFMLNFILKIQIS